MKYRRVFRLRGRCSECGRFGPVLKDGRVWSHRCRSAKHKGVWAKPMATDVQTYDKRIDQFVRSILPLNATEDQIASAIEHCRSVFTNYDPRREGDRP